MDMCVVGVWVYVCGVGMRGEHLRYVREMRVNVVAVGGGERS